MVKFCNPLLRLIEATAKTIPVYFIGPIFIGPILKICCSEQQSEGTLNGFSGQRTKVNSRVINGEFIKGGAHCTLTRTFFENIF